MNSILTCLLLTVLVLPAVADRIIPPSNLFRDPKFVREFVGSYGFHSEVEPKVSPEESRILVKLSDLFDKGQFTQAEQELVRFIKEIEAPTDPEKKPGEISPAMVFVLGNLYFSADRTEEARRAFVEALRRFPKFRRAHVNLGYLYISKEEYDKAMNHFKEAISLGEGSPRVFGLLGYCYLRKEQAFAAENAYRQAFLLDPQSRDWQLGLAQSLIMQEKLEEATAHLGHMIEQYPEDKDLWLQQTNALLGQERKMEAAVNLEILRMKGLADESQLNLLGNLYMDQGEAQLALFAYLAAMEQTKEFKIDQALKSAKILNDYGFPDKAEQFVNRVRAKVGENISDEDLTALQLVEVGIARTAEDLERIGELLEELFKRDPDNSNVLLELGKHYDALAKMESDEDKKSKHLIEAKTRLEIAAGMDEVAYEANLTLGQLLVRERQYIQALPRLERAVELKPSDNLKSYVAKVRRAADRQRQREEQEAAEREAKEAEEQAKKEKEENEK